MPAFLCAFRKVGRSNQGFQSLQQSGILIGKGVTATTRLANVILRFAIGLFIFLEQMGMLLEFTDTGPDSGTG